MFGHKREELTTRPVLPTRAAELKICDMLDQLVDDRLKKTSSPAMNEP